MVRTTYRSPCREKKVSIRGIQKKESSATPEKAKSRLVDYERIQFREHFASIYIAYRTVKCEVKCFPSSRGQDPGSPRPCPKAKMSSRAFSSPRGLSYSTSPLVFLFSLRFRPFLQLYCLALPEMRRLNSGALNRRLRKLRGFSN